MGQLYVDEGARIDVFKGETFRSWGREDLLNLAAVQTIIHHGKSCELPSTMMPDGSIAIALMRSESADMNVEIEETDMTKAARYCLLALLVLAIPDGGQSADRVGKEQGARNSADFRIDVRPRVIAAGEAAVLHWSISLQRKC